MCTQQLHLLEVHKQICFVERNGSLRTASARCFQRVWQEQGFAESDAFEKDASLQRKNEKFVSVQLMNLLTFLGFHSRCNSRHGGCLAGSTCWLGAVQDVAVLRALPSVAGASCSLVGRGVRGSAHGPSQSPLSCRVPSPASDPSTCWETQQKMLQ